MVALEMGHRLLYALKCAEQLFGEPRTVDRRHRRTEGAGLLTADSVGVEPFSAGKQFGGCDEMRGVN